MSDNKSPLPHSKLGSDDHKDVDRLGEKLREAQARRETKTRRVQGQSDGGASSKGLGIALRIGIELVVAVMIGIAVGWFVDRWLGTKPWGMVVFFFFGTVAGFLNVIRTAGTLNQPTDKDTDN